MLIATKVFLASSVAALAMGGPVVVSPLDSPAAGFDAAIVQSAQAELSRQMQTMPPCQADCNLWQALAVRH